MSINDALEQLKEIIQQEVGLVPTINIHFHTLENPALSFAPAAISAADALGRLINEPLSQKHSNGCNWIDIGDNVVVFFDESRFVL